MSVAVKICGLRDRAAVDATIAGGAAYTGFVFYPPSPRNILPEQAAPLVRSLPDSVFSVGLFVNPTDDDLAGVLMNVPLRMIQLHGNETPQRVADIKQRTKMPVIKAIGIAAAQDVTTAHNYEPIVDMLLLDAKAGDLPGGNASIFDWKLLRNATFVKPWMLAGGLTIHNIAEAVATTGATILDVSSGVEDAPGLKNPQKIKDFLVKAQTIERCS